MKSESRNLYLTAIAALKDTGEQSLAMYFLSWQDKGINLLSSSNYIEYHLGLSFLYVNGLISFQLSECYII
jgi:hypothetical protein